jgi:hypothetical protein
VLSVDEKSQIQALDRTQPGLPMKRGRRDCQEFRVRAGIVGWKETPHAPTQATRDRRRAA